MLFCQCISVFTDFYVHVFKGTCMSINLAFNISISLFSPIVKNSSFYTNMILLVLKGFQATNKSEALTGKTSLCCTCRS